MPKNVETIRDFSGGIAKGYNPENLKENQMQECVNFVADGMGKLNVIPGETLLAISSINHFIPSRKGKNIHGWSADMDLSVSGQASTAGVAPVVTELQRGKRAKINFILSEVNGFAESATWTWLLIDTERDQTILDVQWTLGNDASKGAGNNVTDIYTGENGQQNTVSVADKIWRAIYFLEQIVLHGANDNYEYPLSFIETTGATARSTTQNSEADMLNDKFYVKTFTDSNDGWGSTTKYMLTAEYPYFGDLSNFTPCDNETLEYFYFYFLTKTVEDDTDTYTEWDSSTKTVANSLLMPQRTDWNETGNFGNHTIGNVQFCFQYQQPHSESTDNFGAFSRWKYTFEQNKWNETARYEIEIKVYTNVTQNNRTVYSASYHSEIGDHEEDIMSALFGDIQNSVEEDNMIFWEFVDDGVEVFQDARTPKPFGIESFTTTKTDSIIHNVASLTDAQRYQHLIAVSVGNSQASIYSMENDNWLDWVVDLKTTASSTESCTTADDDKTVEHTGANENIAVGNFVSGAGIPAGSTITSVTAGSPNEFELDKKATATGTVTLTFWDPENNTELNFVDCEGYLRIGDAELHALSKPKFFGFMNLDKTYLGIELDEPKNFFVDDAAPVPFTETRASDSASILKYQYSHLAHEQDDIFQYTTDDTQINIDTPTLSAYTPNPAGIRLFYNWIDGTSNSYDKLDGAFMKKEGTEFWWSYVYEGGYISKPSQFKQFNAQDDSTTNHPAYGNEDNTNTTFITNPGADTCSLGLSVSIGHNMINGDGNSGMINTRLKGIEIWGRFLDHDPSNLYLMTEIDLNNGWKSEVTGDWSILQEILDDGSIAQYNTYTDPQADTPLGDCIIYKNYPITTFYSKYGISWDKGIGFDVGGTGWRSACVFNRRAYYGNVRIKGHDGTVEYFPDGIIKSVKGLYDTVSIDNLIEATVNDGDEIICLRVAGNKLCQFKRHSLTVMGIKILENGESRETIDQVIHHVGLSNDNQICDTPSGLFWISRSGIYLFNGENLLKLTESIEGSTISKEVWEAFYGERTHCGYDAYWNQIHICKDTIDNSQTLIYSFNTKAFTEATNSFGSSQKTGFCQDKSGHIAWAEDVTSYSSDIEPDFNNTPMKKNQLPLEDIPDHEVS